MIYKLPYKSDRRQDINFMGEEPILGPESTSIDFGKALSWYSYFFGAEASKYFTIKYLEENSYDKSFISTAKKIVDYKFGSIGWVCRILSISGKVPEVAKKLQMDILDGLIKSFKDETPIIKNITPKIKKKECEIIGLLEEELDNFYKSDFKKSEFKCLDLLKTKNINRDDVQKVSEFYTPLLKEITSIEKGEGRNLTVEKFKNYQMFVENILKDCQSYVAVEVVSTPVKPRKPRRKKVKSPVQLTAKVQLKLQDDEFKLKSLSPTEVIGASQIWTFNTKYRTLSQYQSETDDGFTIKGTTIIGFSDKVSVTKRLRKPMEVLPTVLNTGKVGLRKVMDSIKTTPTIPNGRLNSDTILLRAVKNEKGKSATI